MQGIMVARASVPACRQGLRQPLQAAGAARVVASVVHTPGPPPKAHAKQYTALRSALGVPADGPPSEVALDLASIQHALQRAMDEGAEFALVVRLFRKDGQALAQEARMGSFL